MPVNGVNSNSGETLMSRMAKGAVIGGAAAAGGAYIRSRWLLQGMKDSFTPSAEDLKGLSEDAAAKLKEQAAEVWKEYKSSSFIPNLKEAGKIGLISAGIAGLIAAGYHFLKGSDNKE